MKKLTLILAAFFTISNYSYSETLYFFAKDTVHEIRIIFDSVYVRCNTNGADTTIQSNYPYDPKLDISRLLSVENEGISIASVIKLSGMNFINGRLFVKAILPKPGNVSIRLSDLTGGVLFEQSEYCPPGENNFSLDAPGIAAGIYFLTISNGFDAHTYKILGSNDGTGKISVSNIGTPITNDLAGTSDFTIIAYLRFSETVSHIDTIFNFAPSGAAKDTINFYFQNGLSKWNFNKVSLTVGNIHLIGSKGTSTFWTNGSHYSSNDTVDRFKNYSFLISNLWGSIHCHYGPFSNLDTIRFCYSSQINNGNITTDFMAMIITDTINKNVNYLEFYTYSRNEEGSDITISDLLTYTGKLKYSVDNNGLMTASGKLLKEALAYKYDYKDNHAVGWSGYYSGFENDKFAQDTDLDFTLILYP